MVSDKSPQEYFKSLIMRCFKAWDSLDPKNAAPFYAKDLNLDFFDFAPLRYKGWKQYAAGAKKTFFDQMLSSKLTMHDDFSATRRGNTA